MRLDIEPNVTAIPLVENEMFDDGPTPESHDFQILLKKGIAAAQNGDRHAARTLLAQSTELVPKSEEAWMWLASVSDYPEELLAFLQNVLEINPSNDRAIEWQKATQSLLAKTFVQRGIEAHSQDDGDRARHCFEQALEHDGHCEMAWFWLGSIATSPEEKTKCLQRVLEINPENAEAQDALGSMKKAGLQATLDSAKKQAFAGKHKKALSAIDEVLAEDPTNVDTWILRSHVAADLHEKLASLEKALEIDPENYFAVSSYEFLKKALLKETPSPVAVESEPEQIDSPVCEPPVVTEELVPDFAPSEDLVDQPVDHIYEEPEANVNVETTFAADDDDIGIEYPVSDMTFSSNVNSETDFDVVTDEPHAYSDLSETLETGASDSDEAYEVKTSIESSPIDEEIHETPVTIFAPPVFESETSHCPFCKAPNKASQFDCDSCHAVLTLSDIEAVLSNSNANFDVIQSSLTAMEADWNLREFNVTELMDLAIGHLNLRSFELGFRYLQEASRLDPNNVILTGQLTAIAIRLDEMRRQDEVPDTSPKGKSILVVDDSATVRKLISGKLEKSGHKVVCAIDGVDGLACIAESLPDLVLLDIGMPRMDGYEVCREIRANPAAKDLPVVMISGKDGFFDKVRGRMAGCTGYVTKPFGPETLMKALDTYLKHEPPTDN